MKDELVSRKMGGWCWYGTNTFKETDNVGKFMTFVQDDISNELQELILKAIKQGVTSFVKHTDPDMLAFNPHAKNRSLAIIWYSTDEEKALKGVAKFLINHELVPKTKAGKYYNISFKYDEQTRNGEYGEQFKPSISLKDLMDLNTGVFY
ncbi:MULTISPECIES: hypothetical protein [Bacillus cereus group]|uniref:hypothetical protein n=1 Tax=Bacillus cereus group TaxID=86661 RepID=UPI000975DAAD|nr:MULTISPECIES: hypothetical protein [Bacillus cereus group]MCU5201533.1 hypothetical protein [Bacillus paranthracis]ONG85691.1 hypothetical protein BKK40_27955 [Bacillus cereus]HDR7764815.1 hypothetical protein [Bacillus paranthracis]